MPETSASHSARAKKQWSDPEVRAKMVEGIHARHGKPLPNGRTCTKCKRYKDASFFRVRVIATGPSLRPMCMDCESLAESERQKQPDKAKAKAEGRKIWVEKNPDKLRRQRIRRAARDCGFDQDALERYYETHHGRCEICGKAANESTRYERLSVDHNHQTGAFRGLLCNRCNTAIGLLCDDPAIMRAAALYMERDPIDLTNA